MSDLTVTPSLLAIGDVARQRRRQRFQDRFLFAGFGVFTLITALIAHTSFKTGFSLAFLALMLSCLAAVVRPVIGVHLIIFWSLIGDIQTMEWWPMTKNMSSRESMFFVSDGFSITPLEVLLGITFVSLLLRVVIDRSWHFRKGGMLVPVLAFGTMVMVGFGLGFLRGGNRTVAIMEARPLVYIVVLYVLISTLFTTRNHYRIAFALALLAISIQSIFALKYWRSLTALERELREGLNEHTAAVGMNILFLGLIGIIMFKGTRWKKWVLVAMLPTVLYAYLLSQRRAAMIALFAGVIVLLGVLYYRDRRLFWRFTPTALVLGALYVAATWNLQGPAGLPATAVKTVFFPGQLPASDQASDLYREVEAYNLWFTIRSSPLTGFGFGHRFLVIRRLPDISFFQFWQYLPHNSILWIWIKMGYLGFVAMLYMFGRVVLLGARSVIRIRSADDAVMVTAAIGYVVMFVVFAYVDIGWDVRPAILLALSFALCADFRSAHESSPAPADDTIEPARAAEQREMVPA